MSYVLLRDGVVLEISSTSTVYDEDVSSFSSELSSSIGFADLIDFTVLVAVLAFLVLLT